MRNSIGHRHRNTFTLCIALVTAVVAGCQSSDSSNMVTPFAPAVPTATNIVANAGSDQQSDTAGRTLPKPVAVHVADQSGTAMPGVMVTWTVTAGGGSVASPTSVTDANGNATAIWTLGPTIGQNMLTATLPSGAAMTFHATGIAASAAVIVKVSGDHQLITAGTESQPLLVQVTDAFGNVEAGKVVTWIVATGSGGSGFTSATSVTDSNGLALVTFMTGATPMSYAIIARATGTGDVVFTLISM